MSEPEPETNAKVILHTTHGPLELDLWGKETPAATRNFIQLCLEGFYEDCPFHRILPGFILQTGDPFGDGGQSTTGLPIKLEWHPRLKFNRRGLVGMVQMPTEDGKHTGSASQFFITLGDTPELTKECTLFGKIVGDTIYNVLRMSELEIDRVKESFIGEAPKIICTEVVLNPFDDIIPRELESVQRRRQKKAALDSKPTFNKPKTPVEIAKKKVLSFGDDEEETPVTSVKKRVISSHEALNDPSLSRQAVTAPAPVNKASVSDIAKPPSEDQQDSTTSKMDDLPSVKTSRDVLSEIAKVEAQLRKMDQGEITDASEHEKQKASLSARVDSLSKLLGVKNSAPTRNAPKANTSQLTEAYKERSKMSMGKKRTAMDEMDTLLALNNFREKIKSASKQNTDVLTPVTNRRLNSQPTVEATAESKNLLPETLEICKLHGLVGCESCKSTYGAASVLEGGEGEDEGWLMHKLVFDKESGYRTQIRTDLDSLEVIDPRDRQSKQK